MADAISDFLSPGLTALIHGRHCAAGFAHIYDVSLLSKTVSPARHQWGRARDYRQLACLLAGRCDRPDAQVPHREKFQFRSTNDCCRFLRPVYDRYRDQIWASARGREPKSKSQIVLPGNKHWAIKFAQQASRSRWVDKSGSGVSVHYPLRPWAIKTSRIATCRTAKSQLSGIGT